MAEYAEGEYTMKVIVHGARGRNGLNLLKLCAEGFAGAELAAAVSRGLPRDAAAGTYTKLTDYVGDADVVVDFSNHEATADVLAYCTARHIPAVIATTGHTEEEKIRIGQAAAHTPVFLAYNMSVGVAVVADLVKQAAAAFPDADIEIIEKHHNQKLDVPSGTALMLADRIKEARPDAEYVIGRHENGKRQKQEIGIHSLRLGNETGTHEVIISTGAETITIRHEAENRILFAEGALKAAAFLIGKPSGLYGMRDLL